MSLSDAAANVAARPVVLASRSPRRLELLSRIMPAEQIRVLPPTSSEEAGFDGLTSLKEIEIRLAEIAASKCDDVLQRLGDDGGHATVIAADTVVVVGEQDGSLTAFSQPPDDDWRDTTRRWFLDHYAGRTHSVLTGLCVVSPTSRIERIVQTRVTFRADLRSQLEWYLDTGEPRGKAGGYAIQGAAGLFVERVEGSLTNVIGLPLWELLQILKGMQQNSPLLSGEGPGVRGQC